MTRQTDLQSYFLSTFVTVAGGRFERILGAINDPGSAEMAEWEFHSLSGEASVLGFGDTAELAARASSIAASAVSPENWKQRCLALVENLRRNVDQLAVTSTIAARKPERNRVVS